MKIKLNWRELLQPAPVHSHNPNSLLNKPSWLWLRCISLLIMGSFLSAIGINIFYLPFHFTMGGLSGISAIIYYLTNGAIPLGSLIFYLNIPLLLIGLKEISLRFVVNSLIGTFFFAKMIDFTEPIMTKWFQAIMTPILGQNPDPLIFAVIGGILFGIGLGFIFIGGYTTGGTDIIAVVISKHLKNISLGQIILIIDVIIISLTLIIPSNAKTSPFLLAMYSFISLYISTKAIDIVIEGFNFTRTAYIISDHAQEISEAILFKLNRGVTALKGKGMYTKQDKEVLLCVLSNRQIVQLRELVAQIDEKAFVIVSEAKEVYGEGFHGEKSIF